MSNDKALWGQATHTLTLIGQQNPTPEHIKVLHDGHLVDLIQAIMNGTLPRRDDVRKFYGLLHDILVNYDDMTLEEMIAAGHYNQIDTRHINRGLFTLKGRGSEHFETRVFNFKEYLSTEDVIERMDNAEIGNDWSPAKIEHLLAYGARNPNEQYDHPIVSLDSWINTAHKNHYPMLTHRTGFGRCLYLALADSEERWDSKFHFLAVRRRGEQS